MAARVTTVSVDQCRLNSFNPYGPYADGFPAEQHRFGPFGPIRAKVKDLAAESLMANEGGPNNGSHETESARKGASCISDFADPAKTLIYVRWSNGGLAPPGIMARS
jgi:hypothetical protein